MNYVFVGVALYLVVVAVMLRVWQLSAYKDVVVELTVDGQQMEFAVCMDYEDAKSWAYAKILEYQEHSPGVSPQFNYV